MKTRIFYIIVTVVIWGFLFVTCSGPDELIDYNLIKKGQQFYEPVPPLMTQAERDSIKQIRDEYQNLIK